MYFRIIFVCLAVVSAATANIIPSNSSLQSDGIKITNSSTNGCNVNVQRHLGAPQPLYLRPADGQFVLPQTINGIIQVQANGTINVHCPSGFQGRFQSHRERTINTTCISGNDFRAVNTQIRFNELRCVSLPPHQVRRMPQRCLGGHLFEVGFNAESRFLRLYTVCHNATEGATRWVHYHQNPENAGFQTGGDRPRFNQAGFYPGLNMEHLYTQNEQRRTIARILGSDQLAADLVQANTEFHLSRGHLAARSDFIFGNHQLASFYFINAAPQWQTFNGGNWNTLETYLKRYIGCRNINTEIYTGTYGTVTYKDIRGNDQEIHLAPTNNGRRVPVPKIYYKVVIDRRNRAGIAFIGVNNPYVTLPDILRDYTYCRNVMDRVTYIPWSRHIRMGHLYACSVNEFARAIGELPPLPPTDRLLVSPPGVCVPTNPRDDVNSSAGIF